jgi:serine/threonine protein kinase
LFADPPAGEPMLGRYRLRKQLGSGASGVVFAAFDPKLRRRVALKLLSASCQSHAMREARAMASISHPNVLPIYDAGTTTDAAYLTMELIDGTTLREWASLPRSPAEIVRVLLAAGRGLAAAHTSGVVHRDFKPANVLIDKRGNVKVADFGLAARSPRMLAEDGEPTVTPQRTVVRKPDSRASGGSPVGTGARLGTEPYMSPEEELGLSVDARSDQFSFCATLYELLAGERLFPSGTAAAAATGFVDARLHRLGRRGVSRSLRRILARGLALDPGARYPSMEPLLADLERAAVPRVGGLARRVGLGALLACAILL